MASVTGSRQSLIFCFLFQFGPTHFVTILEWGGDSSYGPAASCLSRKPVIFISDGGLLSTCIGSLVRISGETTLLRVSEGRHIPLSLRLLSASVGRYSLPLVKFTSISDGSCLFRFPILSYLPLLSVISQIPATTTASVEITLRSNRDNSIDTRGCNHKAHIQI